MDNTFAETKCMGTIFTELSAFVFEEVTSGKEKTEPISLSVKSLDKLLVNCIADKYTSYCIDLAALDEEPESIFHFLTKLQDAKNVPIIIFASGYSMDNPLLEELRRYGFDSWVTASALSDMRIELSEALQGANTAVAIAQKEQQEQLQINDTVAPEHRMISFCGTVSCSGTTTQAIQYARFLQHTGVNACYIEASGNNHIQKITTLEKITHADRDLGYLEYKGLDMYYKPMKITPSIRMAYDVCVYDYGVLCAENMPAFLTGLAKVCVANFSPWNVGRLRWTSDVLTKEKVCFLFPYSQSMEKEQIEKILVNNNHTIKFPTFNNTLREPILKKNKELYTFLNEKLLLTTPKKKRRFIHEK